MLRSSVIGGRLTRSSVASARISGRLVLPRAVQRVALSSTPKRLDVPTWPPPPMPQPAVVPSDQLGPQGEPKKKSAKAAWVEWMSSPSFQAGLTTVVGLGMVFLGGVGYLVWYKAHVLNKMEDSFAPGYDPALELGALKAKSAHVKRKEQPKIDSILRGEEAGSYFLMVGPKGTGKGTMILDAMRAVDAEGAGFCEAHPDLEVFRLRLGKALHYEFNEDWQGSLFSRADPRNGGPSLDIERAMNKLEKVALRYTRKKGRPLVLVFNNIHLFPNTDEGHALLHQLQQRAEAWAEGGIMTMVFSTDDFWCLDKMKKNASRMKILSVYDLPASEAIRTLRQLRMHYLSHRMAKRAKARGEPIPEPLAELNDEEMTVLREVYETVGGRTSYLARVARADDMLEEAKYMVQSEKAWLLSKIGLIPEMDDDVMDEQKWSSCSWLLLRALAQQQAKAEEEAAASLQSLTADTSDDDKPDDSDTTQHDTIGHVDVHTPKVSYYDARQIMTRTDFLEGLDHFNIVSIDVNHDIRPDSVMLLRAAREVVEEEGFDDMLDQTRDRVDEIEGLHRQSELTVKEPFRVTFGQGSKRQVFEVEGLGGSFVPAEPAEVEAEAEVEAPQLDATPVDSEVRLV